MKNILLVDDEDCLRNLFAKYLQQKGHNVWQADSGHLGFKVYESIIDEGLNVDAIVTDIHMPPCTYTGVDMVRDLKTSYGLGHTKVIYMTGDTRYIKAPENETLLFKPFSLKTLEGLL